MLPVQVVTHFLLTKSCHYVDKQLEVQILPLEVEEKVNGFDVHTATHVFVVESAKYGSKHVEEQELLAGFINKPIWQLETHKFVAVLIIYPVLQLFWHKPVITSP